MKEFLTAFKDFIYRDVLYIAGGASIIISFGVSFIKDFSILTELPTPMYIYFAVLSYSIGYAVQDGLSLTGLITTSQIVEVHKVFASLYKRFAREPWCKVCEEEHRPGKVKLAHDAYNPTIGYHYVRNHCLEGTKSFLQRTIAIKQIGTTMGSCLLVCWAILIIKITLVAIGFSESNINHDLIVMLSVCAFMVGIILSMLGWIKGMQQSKLVYIEYKHLKESGVVEIQEE